MSVLACPYAGHSVRSRIGRGKPLRSRGVLRVAFAALAAGALGSASKPLPSASTGSELSPPVMVVVSDRLVDSAAKPVLAGSAALVANERRGVDGVIEQVASFRFSGGTDDLGNAIDCLAAAAYYEAGDDPGDQAAVVQVVINRVRHPAYPDSVCDVVFQGAQRATGCQFTFTCDGSLTRRPSQSAWARAKRTAMAALGGFVDARVGSATHYHADYVLPYWAPALRKLAQIGAHIFYRWPGRWGSSAVLRDPAGTSEAGFAVLSGQRGATAGKSGVVSLETIADDVRIEPAVVSSLDFEEPLARSSSTIFTIADSQASPGRWAVSAMDACGGRGECLVLAYADADQLQRNRGKAPMDRDAPLFLLVRDDTSDLTLALWDCTRIQRPSASQCLPDARPALDRLMRDRS